MKLRHFTIRDLFWLILVVALTTGWILDRFKLEAARRNQAAQRLHAQAAAKEAEYAAAIAAAASAASQQQWQTSIQWLQSAEAVESRPTP